MTITSISYSYKRGAFYGRLMDGENLVISATLKYIFEAVKVRNTTVTNWEYVARELLAWSQETAKKG